MAANKTQKLQNLNRKMIVMFTAAALKGYVKRTETLATQLRRRWNRK